MRILVPLVVSDDQLDEGLSVLESALRSVVEKKPALAGSIRL